MTEPSIMEKQAEQLERFPHNAYRRCRRPAVLNAANLLLLAGSVLLHLAAVAALRLPLPDAQPLLCSELLISLETAHKPAMEPAPLPKTAPPAPPPRQAAPAYAANQAVPQPETLPEPPPVSEAPALQPAPATPPSAAAPVITAAAVTDSGVDVSENTAAAAVASARPGAESSPPLSDTAGLPPQTGPEETPEPPAVVPKADFQALLREYASGVKAQVLNRQFYPPAAERLQQEGAVSISFSLDRTGSITALSVKTPSGYSSLDEAALEAVGNAAPFAPFPAGLDRESLAMSITLHYRLD